MTGNELYKIFQQDAGYSYTGNLDTTKANRLFKKALISAIEKKYRELISQKEYDELRQIIKTEKVFTPINNKIFLAPYNIVSALSYTAAPNSVITITTPTAHNFKTGDSVIIFGVAGITTTPSGVINGTYTITVLNETQFTYTLVNSAISGTYTALSGTLLVAQASFIPDYWHLLTVKAKFVKNTFYSPSDFSNATPIIMKLSGRSNLRSGEKINIASAGGNTNANGVRYIKKINSYEFELYSDKDLQTAIAGNGAYTSGAVVSRIFYEYCEKVFSDQKLALFKKPTIEIPGFEETENIFRFYPLEETCSEITLDYIGTPSYATSKLIIDVSNSTLDLEIYYPVKFLYFVIEEAKIFYAEKYRDSELYQQSKIEQQENR